MPTILNKLTTHKVTDDSGFIAIANADNYISFVNENWELKQLMDHFVDEMNKETLIIWATGSENEWTVVFLDNPSNKKAFREFSKTIVVTSRHLFLTNYEDLTMAAQFKDEKIPANYNSELSIKLENGKYTFTIRQLFDPTDIEYDPEGKVNFEIIIKADSKKPTQNIDKVFWLEE